jgi:hypothetical protein
MNTPKTVTSSGSSEGQYLTGEQIQKLIGEIDLSDLELVRMDSYSDYDIYKSVEKTGKSKELLCSAIQTSIVGMGNKKYGSVSVGGELVDIEKLYHQCEVKTKLEIGSVLSPGDLTGRRLQRFFRKQISEFIKVTGTSSYLWRKYSTQNEAFKHITFPGAEHLVTDVDEVNYLFATYKMLDSRLNTNISERIVRVFSARGIVLN